MELTKDLIILHGVLNNLNRTTGDMSKMRYRLGNEDKISTIVEKIKQFLTAQQYLINGELNKSQEESIDNFLFFLIINTEFEHSLEPVVQDCQHLLNTVPQLSRCVLVHIIQTLNLTAPLSRVMQKIPLEIIEEILTEMVPCLRKCDPPLQLAVTCNILQAIVNILSSPVNSSSSNNKAEETVEKITDATHEMTMYLTTLNPECIGDWSKTRVYHHMGLTLLKLLELLMQCDYNCTRLNDFINKIIEACSVLVKSITINVFCSWAESDIDGQTLQTVISWKAYEFITKYMKYEPAQNLTGMLGSIAKKPKTLPELIREADITRIMNMVNKVTPDQKSWYRALLTPANLKNQEAIKCAIRWAHLSCMQDVNSLFDLNTSLKNEEIRKLYVKCASNLNLNDLKTVVSRNLYRNGIDYSLNDNVQQLMIYFNKLKDCKDNSELIIHEAYLLMLQNPLQTLLYFFKECLKNYFYISCLKEVFSELKDVSDIRKINIAVIERTMSDYTPNEDNINQYIELFRILVEVGFISEENLIRFGMCPAILKLIEKESFTELKYFLHILNALDTSIKTSVLNAELLSELFKLLSTSRCKFLNFDCLKHGFTTELVILFNKLHNDCEGLEGILGIEENNHFQKYYRDNLTSESNSSLLKCIHPNFDIENYGEAISRLLQVLPSCVLPEWSKLTEELLREVGAEKTATTLTNVLNLLCQVVRTQEQKGCLESSHHLIIALRTYLRYYGVVMKDQVCQVICNEESEPRSCHEIAVIKNICKLLKDLPISIRQDEGISLVTLLSEEALQKLANDKQFICLIVSINDNVICKTIAQKMIKNQN